MATENILEPSENHEMTSAAQGELTSEDMAQVCGGNCVAGAHYNHYGLAMGKAGVML